MLCLIYKGLRERIVGKTRSEVMGEHIENVRSFVRRKTVIFKDFSIIKEPRMSAWSKMVD
jgi:hypothetical protein